MHTYPSTRTLVMSESESRLKQMVGLPQIVYAQRIVNTGAARPELWYDARLPTLETKATQLLCASKRSTVRLSAVVTTLADSQRRMQTSGRSRDSRAGIFFPNLKWAHDSGVI